MKFDKSENRFSSKKEITFLGHCSVSPLYPTAAEKAIEIIREQQYRGGTGKLIEYYTEEMEQFKIQSARLLRTEPANMAVVKNTSEALSMVANGYPFEEGDEVISFAHEYPANYHRWRLQELKRGVKLKLLPNVPARHDIPSGLVGKWSFNALEEMITPRTKVVALSHVQYTSGYAADLKKLGELCKAHDIDLIVDVAQSLGSMPVFPEEYHIAALASAGWKWLLGPMGTGVFYTSALLRNKLDTVQVGAETMEQAWNFLDLDWNPVETAKRFEYSTSPVTLVAALATCMREVHNPYGAEAIFREILRLQDLFLEKLDSPFIKPLLFEPEHRSGVLSLYCEDLDAVKNRLKEAKVFCAPRAGYLRVAPHYFNTEEDMESLAELLNER